MRSAITTAEAAARLARLRGLHGMKTVAFVPPPAPPPDKYVPPPPAPPKEKRKPLVVLRHRARCWNCGASGNPNCECFGKRYNQSCIHWHPASGFEWIKWDDYVPENEENDWNEESYGRSKEKNGGRSDAEIANLFG